jgi:DNA-binding response OmpR family regulator
MIDLENMSILIVDDMESMRKSIRGMLRMLHIGKLIRHAENGREGWKALNEIPVDLAIIDWNMPIMKGIELLELIRSNKQMRDMPVIMITAEAEKKIVVEAAESDIDGYLLKPLTTQSLDERIRSVIKLANDPNKSTTHFLKARDFEEQGEITLAIAEIKEALKERPNSSRILRKLGQLYAMKDNDDVAEKCFLKAVAVNSQDAISRYILSELYLKKDNLAGAVKYYDQAIAISPRNIASGVDLGNILIKRGMGTQALEIFKKVLKHSGKNLMHVEKAAECCIEAGELGYARKLLESVIEENPERYDLVFKLAALCERDGDTSIALGYYKTVDDNTQNNLNAKMRMAKIYFSLKKVYVVDDLLKQILKIDPENIEAKTMMKNNF